ncbi:MAG: hypothetical protein U0452_11360 [Anaerolineae bacterium]
MPFTDRSDLFGAVHEEGINRVVRHIMRQRPSLFNYATPFFRRRPDLLCTPIVADRKVTDARNPLFTVQDPLPILGAPVKIGLNFCVQLTDFVLDFHPSNSITLPPELGTLAAQRFAIRARACVGIDCPPDDILPDFIREMEEAAVRNGDVIVKPPRSERRLTAARPALRNAALEPNITNRLLTQRAGAATPAANRTPSGRRFSFGDIAVDLNDLVLEPFRPDEPRTLPTRALICVCLELFAVAHFEFGPIGQNQKQYLKPRMDGIEIVDLQPMPMENAIECFLKTTLRLGILPRLVVPIEAIILDITKVLSDNDVTIEEKVSLRPTPTSAQLPFNPSIEGDQLKAFINLVVEEA